MLRRGNVVILTTSEEKQEGLGKWLVVPTGIYFLFPFSGHPNRVHSYNMREPILVYQLARNLSLVQSTILDPLRIMDLDRQTIHVIESSLKTARPSNFKFLKEYVR
jgi:hypothetical protein